MEGIHGSSHVWIIQQYKRGWFPWSDYDWHTIRDHMYGGDANYHSYDNAAKSLHYYDGSKPIYTVVTE